LKIEIKTVINSINNNEGNLCVDIFKRNNQTFGFEEYRRDPETNSGWYKIGFYSNKVFKNDTEALEHAKKQISWLKNKI
jgi:hypothetical protein